MFDKLKDRFESAVFLDERSDRSHQDGYDHGFKHSGSSAAHGGERGDIIQHACCGSGEDKQKDADAQNNEDIDPEKRKDQDDEIRNCLDQVIGIRPHCGAAAPQGQDEQDDQGDQRGRKSDAEIGPEFVLHQNALRLGGGNGGIGDKGQVVSEHGAADNGSDTERK